MNKNIETIRNVRIYLLSLIRDLTIEELNEVPVGYSNNIIWNLAHMTAAQQGICYRRAGLQTPLDDKYINPYMPNTKPEGSIDAAEVEVLKGLFLSSVDLLQADYDNNLFASYNPWSTRYGVALADIDDALGFLPFHEGFHSGYITSLKKMVHQQVGLSQ